MQKPGLRHQKKKRGNLLQCAVTGSALSADQENAWVGETDNSQALRLGPCGAT